MSLIFDAEKMTLKIRILRSIRTKEVLNNFGRSDDNMICTVKKCLFPIDAYVVSCPTCKKILIGI